MPTGPRGEQVRDTLEGAHISPPLGGFDGDEAVIGSLDGVDDGVWPSNKRVEISNRLA